MANRFWVGGTGTWDGTSTANWSATTGGAAGASAPTTADAVIFDSLSGTGTCTTAAGAACASVNLNSATVGLTLGANLSPTGAFTFTQGTLSLASYTLTCLTFNASLNNVRTLAFGTGNITITGNNTTILYYYGTTLTVTGSKNIYCTYSGATGTRTLSIDANNTESTAPNIYVTAGTDTIASITRVNTLDFTGFAGTYSSATTKIIYGDLKFASGMTITGSANNHQLSSASNVQKVTSAGLTLDFPITAGATGTTNTVQLQDNLTMGSTRTFTLTAGTLDLVSRTLSTGLFASSNTNTRAIAFGTGNITVTGNNATIWTTATSTGLSFTGTPTVNATYSGATGTRTISVGNTAGGSEALAINLNVTAATDIVNLSLSSNIKNLTFTSFTGTAGVGYVAWGNLTLSAGMTISGSTNGPIFSATSGTTTITTNGVSFDRAMSFVGVGGNYEFQDALTMAATRVFFISNGTVRLKAGATTTVGVFSAGQSNPKTLRSTLTGTQATLSQSSGTVSTVNMTIQDINATGGATWNAFVDQGNIDAGNVDGWDFGISPVVGGAEYTYALRSFTQPRRF